MIMQLRLALTLWLKGTQLPHLALALWLKGTQPLHLVRIPLQMV